LHGTTYFLPITVIPKVHENNDTAQKVFNDYLTSVARLDGFELDCEGKNRLGLEGKILAGLGSV